ncbi:MAG TPA: hypothetical protein VLZ89_05870 [Anaerolineales bacterium]|nr:hypothetical protein [Anaerolineales bacterium]
MDQKNNVHDDLSNAVGAEAVAGRAGSARRRDTELQQHALYLFIALVGIFFGLQALNLAARARQQAAAARAGELAVQSISVQDTNFPLAMLLGIEADRTADTSLARIDLLDNVATRPALLQFLDGDTSDVESVAFSPDGKTLACAHADGTIILWDVTTRSPIGRPLAGHAQQVNSVAFSPDSKTLAAGSSDGTIMLWAAATGQPIGQVLTGHSEQVNSVAFSPDGKTLASGSNDGIVVLWDAATRQPIHELTGLYPNVSSVAFSPDGETLASASGDTINLWIAPSLQANGQLQTGDVSGVNSIAFSPDGKYLVSGNGNGTVDTWNTATRQPIIGRALNTGQSSIRSVALSPVSLRLATGSADHTITVWTAGVSGSPGPGYGTLAWVPLSTPNSVLITGHTRQVNSVAFSPDGRMLASGSSDGTVVLWDMPTLFGIREIENHLGRLIEDVRQIYEGNDLIHMTFSPATGDGQKEEIWWDVTTRQPIGQWVKPNTSPVPASVALSPDGKTLASSGYDDTVILWDVATGQMIGQPLTGHTGSVISIAFSPDGRTLASGSSDETIILWDVATRQPIGQPLMGHSNFVSSVAFSPDGRTLASGSENAIILWNVATREMIGQPLRPFKSLLNYYFPSWTFTVTSVAFSPDGKMLASAANGYDAVFLWDVAAREMIGQPLLVDPPYSEAGAVAFSPDGKMLAYDNNNGTIALWDVATRQMIEPLGYNEPYSSFSGDYWVPKMAFSPDGKTLVSEDYNYMIIQWDLDPGSLIEETCQRVGRNLTQAEWEQYFPDEPYRVSCPQWPAGQ